MADNDVRDEENKESETGRVSIFRQKSIDRISSPEEFDEYVRVSNPGIWFLLLAVLAILIAVICWGFLGRIENRVDAAIECDGVSDNFCVVEEHNATMVKPGMIVRTENGDEFTVVRLESYPLLLTMDEFPKLIHALNQEDDCWVYEIILDYKGRILEEGDIEAQVVETVVPASFLTN